MPFVDVSMNCSLSRENEQRLKQDLGEAIRLIPGKSEESLMVRFTEKSRMWFAGSEEGPLVFINVMLYGTSAPSALSVFSKAIIEKVKAVLPAKKVYVKFEEVPNWFWD